MSLRIILGSITSNPGNSGQLGRKLAAAVCWQIRKRVSARPQLLRLANGARFWAHPDCVVSSALHYSDWPEYHELMFCRQHLQPGQIIFDVGANVGHFSLLLADRVGSKQVVAFEPTPVAFQRLRENFAVNQWTDAKLVQAAVGRQCGRIKVPDLARPDTTNSPANATSADRTVEVPLVSLDSLAGEYRGRQVGLLKVDVEGFEPEVFGGGGQFIQQVAPQLVMFESLGGQPDSGVAAVLEGAGYRLFQLNEAGRPQTGDLDAQNLFAAKPEVLSAWMQEGTGA
ncbi:MAG: FkbM family methyltransferase [Proteobacteria bacterium]|nr:FkbM family methyltransferase [Pseudomonadota bacterium]